MDEPERRARPAPSLLRGWLAQLRCLEALIIRDMMMRYGRGNLGFMWVLIEPMILTIGVMLIWTMIKGEREHGITIIALVLTGYMPLTLWRHLTNNGVFALRRNASLLYHRNVTLLDVFMGRMALELGATTAALAIVAGTLMATELIEPIADYGTLAAGWLAMGALALGSALVICVLTEYSETWERFIQPYQYLMLPLSGCFFMVDWLPTAAQTAILFNPTVHCFEAFRAGFFGEKVATHYNLWYPFLWAIGLLAVGLRGLDAVRDRLHLG